MSKFPDVLGCHRTQTGPLGTVASEWDIGGRRTRIAHPDGFYVDQDYLVTGEPTAIRENGATSGAGVLATYAWDNLGRRASLTRGDGSVLSYGYDAVSRLTQLADNLVGTAYDQTLGFGYTPASQIASNTRSNDAYAWTGHYNVNRGYTANGRNQYTATGSITPTYDTKGNLTSAGSTTYAYTSENLLTSASGGIALAYDPAMRLYQTSGGSAGTARLAYDGTDLIAEYNGSNAMLRRYVHGPGTDEPLVWYEGSGTTDRRFLHTDERGSVVAVTNSSGTTLNVNGYNEYGIPSSGNVGRFQYTGQTWLPELGMYYYKARIYSPTLGRFLQPDPIGYGGGMNMYAYVGGDPINSTDPGGTCAEIVMAHGGDCAGSTARAFVANAANQLSGGIVDPKALVRDIMSFLRYEMELDQLKANYDSRASSILDPIGFDISDGMPWTTSDFFHHYFEGTGSTIQLSSVGLAGFFENDPTVRTITTDYISFVTSVRVEEFHLPLRQIGVSDLTYRLVALGNSAVYGESWCRYTSCFFRFSINDAFEDLLDLGLEIPGGVPYRIRHEWGVVARRRGGW